MTAYWQPLLGGVVIGLSAVLLLLVNGRIAGISGIVGRLIAGDRLLANGAFVLGLVLGPVAFQVATGAPPAITDMASLPVLVIAGLLVGFGTRMGSGCTSGHGILGLARLSPRSMAAVATFLAAGVVTATIMGFFR